MKPEDLKFEIFHIPTLRIIWKSLNKYLWIRSKCGTKYNPTHIPYQRTFKPSQLTKIPILINTNKLFLIPDSQGWAKSSTDAEETGSQDSPEPPHGSQEAAGGKEEIPTLVSQIYLFSHGDSFISVSVLGGEPCIFTMYILMAVINCLWCICLSISIYRH